MVGVESGLSWASRYFSMSERESSPSSSIGDNGGDCVDPVLPPAVLGSASAVELEVNGSADPDDVAGAVRPGAVDPWPDASDDNPICPPLCFCLALPADF